MLQVADEQPAGSQGPKDQLKRLFSSEFQGLFLRSYLLFRRRRKQKEGRYGIAAPAWMEQEFLSASA